MTATSRSGAARASLDQYLEEIGRVPLLDPEEEARLARLGRAGDVEARERLVTANLRFVVAIARRYRERGLPMEDLVNEGNVGLLRAAERFDEARGVRFVTYAVWWIRQAIVAALRAEAGLPDSGRRPAAGDGGRRPSGRSGAGGRRDRGRRPDRRAPWPRPLSLEASRPTGTAPLRERLRDDRLEPPDLHLHREALRGLLDAALASLPPREEEVLRLYFGVGPVPDGNSRKGPARPVSLAEIGRRMGVSRERVRQVKERGLRRLRVGGAGSLLRPYLE